MAPLESVVNLPVGFQFRPTDDQLLAHYLLNKVRGTSHMNEDKVIQETDLYGEIEPWDIWREFGGHNLPKGEDLYFFTKLKSLRGSLVVLKIGSGTWKGENAGTAIRDPISRRKIGWYKRFHYENPKSVQDGCWLMHEYSLHSSLVKPKPNSTNQFVLCRIRKNDRGKKKLRTAEEDNETDTPVQSQNRRQRRQQVTSFEELIGNCTPMSAATPAGVGGSVSNLPTGLTQSQNRTQKQQQVTRFEELIGNCTPMSEATPTGVSGSVSYLPAGLTQSQNRRQSHQQVTGFEGLIGNCTPMSEATPTGICGSVSYLPTGLTQSQPGSSFAYPTTVVSSQARENYNDEVSQVHGGGIGRWPSPFGGEEDPVNAFGFSTADDYLLNHWTTASSEANMVIID